MKAPQVERIYRVGVVKRYRVLVVATYTDRHVRMDCRWLDELPMLGGQVTWPARRRRQRRKP